MAEEKLQMNWKQRIESGVALNPLQDVQATADFNFKQRQAEQKAREEFEARKRGGYTVADDGADTTADEDAGTSNEDGKKDKK